MENVIRKLYGMYMDNDNREKNEMSVMHDDLCKEKKEKAYQCYQKLRVQLTDELAEELDELMNKHMEIYPQELEESFAMGFKTGARLMCEIFSEKTEEIIRIIEEIPKADEIVAMLEKVHGVKSLEDIGFTPDMKEKTARVAPYIRDRITFMRILKFYDFYDDVIK